LFRSNTTANIVGPKGQVVIAKEYRDQLGIEPGWIALQRLEDDHIEVYFVPPGHKKSLKGCLAGQTKTRLAAGREWDEARDSAWKKAAEEKMPDRDELL
jgi:bifunctional DNA-binding transcriptional regulator/antitoxin component of YhaV-PrlF toxin-antitoxin module